jgi:uncharacterized membrane protein YbhN (UPF0104 family)
VAVAPASAQAVSHRWRTALRLLVAIAVLGALFRWIPLREVLVVLRSADPAGVALAFAWVLALQVAVAFRLRILAAFQGLGLSTLAVLEINLATRFYGFFLPGGSFTGIAIRVFRLSREPRDWAAAGVAMLADRALATASLCAIGALFCAAARPPDPALCLIPMLAVGGGLALLCIPLFSGWGASTTQAAEGGAQRAAGERRRAPAMDWLPLPASWRGALGRSRLAPADLARVLAASLLAHLFGTAAHLCLARALDLEIGFATIGWVRAAMLLATLLPVSIAGLGLREGAAVLLLARHGIGDAAALAFALLVFAVSELAVSALGGLFEAVRFASGGRLAR